VNGSGSWIAGVPQPAGAFWYAGASYELDPKRLQDDAMQHASNLERLRALSDKAASTMATALADKTIGIWRGTRCVTHDRLPLVGPLEATAAPSLWICAGMGSRGLSLAALSAELLAAHVHGEPLPLEQSLSKRLLVNRPAKGRKAG
jgi:tRNA 5-methylaminomethyl-2-thiouridine biosynthesis bifunctional protein